MNYFQMSFNEYENDIIIIIILKMQDKVMSSDLESNNQLDDKNFNNPI